MITELQALILGIIQGLTEFLPVSSSGHLVIAQKLFGLNEPPLAFDVLLHLGTLFATVIVFKDSVFKLARSVFRIPTFLKMLFQKGHLAIGDEPEVWTLILISVSTAITGVIGILFHDQFKKAFASLPVVSLTLFTTGTLLFLTRNRVPKGGKTPTLIPLKDACILGFAQGLAILPGLSRSGTTISVALFLGFNRQFAGEYSFLISLPAVAGAVFLESYKGFESLNASMQSLSIGFVMSFLLGTLSLKLLIRWIRSGRLSYFAFYCWMMGTFAAILALKS